MTGWQADKKWAKLAFQSLCLHLLNLHGDGNLLSLRLICWEPSGTFYWGTQWRKAQHSSQCSPLEEASGGGGYHSSQCSPLEEASAGKGSVHQPVHSSQCSPLEEAWTVKGSTEQHMFTTGGGLSRARLCTAGSVHHWKRPQQRKATTAASVHHWKRPQQRKATTAGSVHHWKRPQQGKAQQISKCSPLEEASAGKGSVHQPVHSSQCSPLEEAWTVKGSAHRQCSPLEDASAEEGSAQQQVFTTGRALSRGRLNTAASVHHWKRPQQSKARHSSQCSPLEEASAEEGSAQQQVFTTGRGLSRGRLAQQPVFTTGRGLSRGRLSTSTSAQQSVFTSGRGLDSERLCTAGSVHHWKMPQQRKAQHSSKCSPLEELSAGDGSTQQPVFTTGRGLSRGRLAQQPVFTTGRGLSRGRLNRAAHVHHWRRPQQGKAVHSRQRSSLDEASAGKTQQSVYSSQCSALEEASAGEGSAQQQVFTTGRGLSRGRLSTAPSVHHWMRPQQGKAQHSRQCSPLEEASAGEVSVQQQVFITGRGLSRGRLSIAAHVHHWRRPQQGKAVHSRQCSPLEEASAGKTQQSVHSSQCSPLEEASAGEGSAQQQVFTTGRGLSRGRLSTAGSVHHWKRPQQRKALCSSKCSSLEEASAGEGSPQHPVFTTGRRSAEKGSEKQAVFTTGRGLGRERFSTEGSVHHWKRPQQRKASTAASVHHWKRPQQGKAQHSGKCSSLEEASGEEGSVQQQVFITGRGLSRGRLSTEGSVHHWKRPQQRKVHHRSKCSSLEDASAEEGSAQQLVFTTGRGLSR
ncbi:hypothetical protein NDU88_000517 [Pleurodeles waltl]|uniref:Uncharacterized protein n=1 Tax=Pleurodeles waltl TaxID=8319 RepID=A0AAV7R4G8_PLEWA|nr:hypothetical protein NDU88_000517 [Pleurodeles waltl]